MRKRPANPAAQANAVSPEQTDSAPKTEPASTPASIKSIVRNTLLASPDFPRLYADYVISSAPNSKEAKMLAENYKKITEIDWTNMTTENVKTCTHIKVTGVRCGSPALRGEDFCYFHQRMHRTVKGPNSRLHHVALLENEEAIQASIMEIINALIRGTIELRRGELILRALNAAVRNARRVRFDNASGKMVTHLPDYNDPPAPAETTNVETAAPGCPVAKMDRVGTAAPGCPGGPEVSGRGAVDSKPDPTRPKPPAGVNESEAPKERKIAAHRASGG